MQEQPIIISCTQMGSLMISSHINVLVLLLALFLSSTSADLAELIGCPVVDLLKLCGHGKCKSNSSASLQFDCICEPGWKSGQILNFTIPSCFLPNCTVDYQCGNGNASPPPPPQLNMSCLPALCFNGSCAGGVPPTCTCDQGYANLLDNPQLTCLPKCYLSGKCNNGLSPPPSTTSASAPGKGSNDARNYSMKTLQGLIMILWATMLVIM